MELRLNYLCFFLAVFSDSGYLDAVVGIKRLLHLIATAPIFLHMKNAQKK